MHHMYVSCAINYECINYPDTVLIVPITLMTSNFKSYLKLAQSSDKVTLSFPYIPSINLRRYGVSQRRTKYRPSHVEAMENNL